MKYEGEVEEFRKSINRLDEEIVEKLAQRLAVAVRIGAVKRKYGRPIVDPTRETLVYERVQELARTHCLDEVRVERIFREIIGLCTEAQVKDKP